MADSGSPAAHTPDGCRDPASTGAGGPASSSQWYVWLGGEIYGPVNADTIRQWGAEGRLQPGWQVQPPGGEMWLSPTAVPELRDAETLTSPPPRSDPFHILSPALDEAPPFGDVLRQGWELWCRNIAWGVVLMLLQGVLIFGPAALPALGLLAVPPGAWASGPFDGRWLLGIAAGVLCLLLLPPVALGATTCAIDTARADAGTLAPLLSGFRQWSSTFVLTAGLLVLSFMPYVGYLMIFVTPIYSVLYWALADRQRGLVDAVQQVPALMARRYWWLFITLLVAGLIGSAGVFLLGVGLLFSGPLQYLITSVVYLDLAAREGWNGSERAAPTGGRLALEVVPMVALAILLLGGLVVAYLVWWV
jgi:hypothetical protein